MCICTGECPGFQGLDLWALINRVRNELSVEYAIVHPQLCVDDGGRFWRDYFRPGRTYVVGACDPRMQRKMFKDAFAEMGGATLISRWSPWTCATCPLKRPSTRWPRQ